ncbi:MAG: DUF899 family protein [Candidatus Eremiobacterota bacterium]
MSFRFPNESAEYRAARLRLLEMEADLVVQMERVAEERRRLPQGGVVPEDYPFDAQEGSLRLSALFGAHDCLLLYALMYGPQAQPCPNCCSLLDGFNAVAPHLTRRVALAVVARSPIGRTLELARSRGWGNLRMVSSANNTYNLDYGAEDRQGHQLPMMNVFVRKGEAVHHFWGTELLHSSWDSQGSRLKGADPRHMDLVWPLWPLLDMTPQGRGTDWYPSLSYGCSCSA